MQILTSQYLVEYVSKMNILEPEALNNLSTKANYTQADFDYYIQASAAYSSNIEGNSIDVDTYLKNKKFNVKSKPKEMAEIDDLIAAYNFAIKTALTQKSFLDAHKILSKSILSLSSQRGKLRNQQVGIFSNGKLEYMAVEPEFVKQEMVKLFSDIKELLSRELFYQETLYYAAMIHLILEKIHPFMDGNGRAGRLLEKWFLAEKIGKSAWSLQSEKYYAIHRQEYYEKIHIGPNYYTLKMKQCLPFLLMLPKCLERDM
ncbi:MAG: Fic family protein [Bacteroidetes bacterium]|nr:Fic family protein [Bacteroidota bacterium]